MVTKFRQPVAAPDLRRGGGGGRLDGASKPVALLYRPRDPVDNLFMKVLLDSQPLAIDRGTLGDLIDAAQAALGGGGRVIVEVRFDGDIVGAAAMDERMDQPVEASVVELESADPRALTQETLGQVASALNAVRDEQEQAAALYRSDQANEATEHAREALGVWQQAQATVMHAAQLLQLDLDRMTVGDQTVPALIEGLVEQLRAFREQLQAGDWLGVADTLEFELADAAERWSLLIAELQRQIDSGTEPGAAASE